MLGHASRLAKYTFAILLFTTLSALASPHAVAISNPNVPDALRLGCVHWKLVSYTVTPITGPSGQVFEYYVVWSDEWRDYQASSTLVSQPLSATRLTSFAPVTCP